MDQNDLSFAVLKKSFDIALSETKVLTCPFCSAEFIFEFSMKDHLKNHHLKEMEKLDLWPIQTFNCPVCGVLFYYSNLIPKHINFAHGKEKLDDYFDANDNLLKYQIDKESGEPTVKFFDCSSDLSELFNDLGCNSAKKFRGENGSAPSTPLPSILKKTPLSGKIVILSPQSAALKRTINNLKRTSARRELRFDLPPLQSSPPVMKENLANPPHESIPVTPRKKRFWKLFRRRKSPQPVNSKIKKKIREKACKMSRKYQTNQMITSTPRNFPDSDQSIDELDESIGSNWKSAYKTSNFRPLCLEERYQCNFCQLRFDCNAELLFHQKHNHKRISFLPPYRCGQCKSTFYRNRLLVRHCNYQHVSATY